MMQIYLQMEASFCKAIYSQLIFYTEKNEHNMIEKLINEEISQQMKIDVNEQMKQQIT